MNNNNKNTINQDGLVLLVGIVICIALTLMLIWVEPYMFQPTLLPDQGVSWYYWKLPQLKLWNYLTPWIGYLAHQLIFWGMLYLAQHRIKRYSKQLNRYNWMALLVNLLFVFLHLFQTAYWYDGIAQTTPVWSSQAAVAIMMIWVLLMENKRRGLFFGKKVPISQGILAFALRNHGYYFSWAIIYTFWFHPMVNTPGHLAGFFYLYLLLLQSSLFFTTVHTHRWWTFTLEILVMIHGSLVAINQPFDIWPMFAFGFGGILVITQMHGLGLAYWLKTTLLLTYIVLAVIIYSDRSLFQLNELIRIPVIDYLGVLILCGIFYLCLKVGTLTQKIKSRLT